MKRVFSNLTWGTAIVAVLGFSLFLVAFSILNAAGFSTGDFFPDLRKPATPPPIAENSHRKDEVVAYTLFTTVRYSSFPVVTGTQYASTSNPVIEAEWCYISTEADSGEVTEKLVLANVDGTGILSVPTFSTKALKTFNLTRNSALSLMGTHCRFRSRITGGNPIQPQKSQPNRRPRLSGKREREA
ncbi:hypothetical protein [uncultured Roseibium sp.]|uniref:hypothetical protein n=1 Tax=uncultured Roseibium sp. TaxID=1936171 RepID=UPI003216862C